MSHGAMRAQIGKEHVKIEAGTADPAFDRLASDLRFYGDLDQIEKGRVGVRIRRSTSVTTKASGMATTIPSSRASPSAPPDAVSPKREKSTSSCAEPS